MIKTCDDSSTVGQARRINSHKAEKLLNRNGSVVEIMVHNFKSPLKCCTIFNCVGLYVSVCLVSFIRFQRKLRHFNNNREQIIITKTTLRVICTNLTIM